MQRYDQLESSHEVALDLLRTQLEEATATITGLREVIDGNQAKGKELEEQIDLLEKNLSKKEDEIFLVQKELKTSESTKCALDTEKEKAQLEIQALHQRLQVSEGWMAKIEETFKRCMILNTDDTISGNWDFIEKRLQIFSKDGIDLHPNSPLLQTSFRDCTPSHSRCSTARSENSSLKRKRITGTQSEGFVCTTEVIYRSRDVHPAATISPKTKPSVQPKDNSPTLTPATGLPGSIVPFSHMQKGFHLQVSPSSNENLSDIEHLFPSTPKNIAPAPEGGYQTTDLNHREVSKSTSQGVLHPLDPKSLSPELESHKDRVKRRGSIKDREMSLTSVGSDLASNPTMVNLDNKGTPLSGEAALADHGLSAINQQLGSKGRLRSILKTSTASSTSKWIAKSDTQETYELVKSPETPKTTGSRRQTFAGLDKEIRATSSSMVATKLSPAHRANRNRATKKTCGRSRRKYSGMTLPFHHSNAAATNRHRGSLQR